MATPNKLQKVEAEFGDLHEIIPELVEKLGSQKAAAEVLGVSPSTISIWLKENGYEPEVKWVRVPVLGTVDSQVR